MDEIEERGGSVVQPQEWQDDPRTRWLRWVDISGDRRSRVGLIWLTRDMVKLSSQMRQRHSLCDDLAEM